MSFEAPSFALTPARRRVRLLALFAARVSRERRSARDLALASDLRDRAARAHTPEELALVESRLLGLLATPRGRPPAL